jgi:serine O-acetyltransferase
MTEEAARADRHAVGTSFGIERAAPIICVPGRGERKAGRVLVSALSLYRVGRWCLRHHVPVIPHLLQALGQVLFAAVVPAEAQIGRDTALGYRGLGIVIHKRASIGENVMVGPGVTIGGGRTGQEEVPVIEDDVFIGTGAKILGPVRVGRGSVIGANAVVIRDVPERSVVAGVPGRIIRSDIDVREYGGLPRDVKTAKRS